MTTLADVRRHGRRRFSGRDPQEHHRAATPLELLYDLTIVVAFGTASDELAHFVADDHVAAGIGGFVLAAFAVSWAWVNYSWFASAYDTDDWVFRLATMVQMVGVIVLSLGLPQMFESLDHGEDLAIGVMVAGYVVMRVPLVFLWWQVSRHDPEHAPAARSYMASVGTAQVGWVLLAVVSPPVAVTLVLFAVLVAYEMAGPFVAEHKSQTPWHAHHIAERYGLLVIITLGEVIIGTVASINAVVHGEAGWTVDAALLALAGVGLDVRLVVGVLHRAVGRAARPPPRARVHLRLRAPVRLRLDRRHGRRTARRRLRAGGRGGDRAGRGRAQRRDPVRRVRRGLLHPVLGAHAGPRPVPRRADRGDDGLLALSVVLAAAGVSVAVCLVVLALAPAVTVVGYETLGHRHMAEVVDRL